MKSYRSYLFRNKDPAIDDLRTLVEDVYGEKVNNKSLSDMEKNGGPSVGCMRGWFFGITKRPNNTTLEAAGRSFGYRRTWVKMKEK
jgi:hypothetical protein